MEEEERRIGGGKKKKKSKEDIHESSVHHHKRRQISKVDLNHKWLSLLRLEQLLCLVCYLFAFFVFSPSLPPNSSLTCGVSVIESMIIRDESDRLLLIPYNTPNCTLVLV